MRVLISGAGAAGLSLAHFLGKLGHEICVVELAPSVRNGGSAIDIRGDALQTARRMGILAPLQEAQLRMLIGMQFVDTTGAVIASLQPDSFNTEDYEEGEYDIEITRDALNAQLLDVLGDTEIRFSTTVEDLIENEQGVQVRLSTGQTEQFDLVVGADGLHSAIRRYVFGPEHEFVHHLGLYVSVFELPPELSAGSKSVECYNTPGRAVLVMNYGDRTSGGVIFRSSPLDYDFRDVEQQKNLVRAVFDVETGWKIEQLRNALENAQEFYFDSISQVKAPSWSKGRVVLIGDAAHCSALLSGMGTSLGMLGAAALADELAASPDDRATAFYRYEEQIRPLVDRAQRSVGKNGDNLVPATAEAIASRNEQIVAAALAANNV